MYKAFCADYPVITIEDPFDEDDLESTAALTVEGVCQVVGDDLLVTNPKRVKNAIDKKACNALLLKVNQIGSVTESIEAVRMSKVLNPHPHPQIMQDVPMYYQSTQTSHNQGTSGLHNEASPPTPRSPWPAHACSQPTACKWDRLNFLLPISAEAS